MAKHTPGPWIARKCGTSWAIDYNADQEQVVDYVYEEADAHLIAAAPDLFAALKAIAALYEWDEGCRQLPEYAAACSAIAKAEGNDHG